MLQRVRDLRCCKNLMAASCGHLSAQPGNTARVGTNSSRVREQVFFDFLTADARAASFRDLDLSGCIGEYARQRKLDSRS